MLTDEQRDILTCLRRDRPLRLLEPGRRHLSENIAEGLYDILGILHLTLEIRSRKRTSSMAFAVRQRMFFALMRKEKR